MFRLAGKRLARFCSRRFISSGAPAVLNKNFLLISEPRRLFSADAPKFPSHQQNLMENKDKMPTLSENEFTKIAKMTLDVITEQLEELADDRSLKIPDDFDVNFSGDVLTLKLGENRGTYVLNTQTPNRQIWLSSPFSGPKRFDFTPQTGTWVYQHDGSELGQLLSYELSAAFQTDIIIHPYNQKHND